MAIDYEQIWNHFNSQTFKTQTIVALAKTRRDILVEDPATPNHSNRIIFARAMKPQHLAIDILWDVLGLPAVLSKLNADEDPTDADVQDAVDAIIDSYIES
ncbi:hypothetical protein C4588_07180 [Candidatus Parcubacteria bacterium]|nr:MAG: hypothetical protein C4588_07180 [Candidatus Parcubacteria bacterium]